ncbi:hypothetical protein G6045_05545 [Streptomyces sp. YC504]|uniref:Uncharacterized protein n=1 Tax=Streptomyces mesophilus TaxID=1775132 RepID=A0A6G4XCM8_9ACTN|nr:hypothetical protein [Streptomyces mesophilus]NGO75148.1 hypothetical protein [Streptomyces mesophilus]
MHTDPTPRRIRAWWCALAVVVTLGVVAFLLYSTGTYDSWRDGRSLDRACDGTLAQDGLAAAIGSSRLKAEPDDGSSLAQCFVKTSPTGTGRAVQVTLRWSTTGAPSGASVWYDTVGNGVDAQAAPLGQGWSGVVRRDGTWQVMVSLDCVNQKSKALVAYGDLYGTSDGTALTGLGRVTTETARKAADKYGCRVDAGKPLAKVPTAQLGKPDTAKPLSEARGSCAALRGTRAAQSGTPQIMEYPLDADAPQTNCYLVTKDHKPGYGLYAYYGAAAKDFQSAGPDSGGNERVWATADCPRSAQEAIFVLYRLYDRDTDSFPAARYSTEVATSVLKAFADREAQLRGCSDVRVISGKA